MNILQVQDALKNASDMQLAGELQNPTGLAPSYLVLSEMKRRQQMRQGAQQGQAPQSSMAEEAASQAQSDYYPEEQPQEEDAGIEAFREGGVVRMAEGGRLPVFRPMPSIRPSAGSRMDYVLGELENEFAANPGRRNDPAYLDSVARQYGIDSGELSSRVNALTPRGPTGSMGSYMESETAGLRAFNPNPPATRAGGETVPPPEASGELPIPPAPPGATAQPSGGGAGSRGGAMPSGAAQPSGQTTDPNIQALYDRLRATGRGREDYRKDAVNTALMQAGLAMMSSQSPNALSNLGQGGLRGLESYTQEMREGRQGERQSIQDEITIRRAQTEEAYRRGIITNQERQLRLAELRMGQAAGERAEDRRAREENLNEARTQRRYDMLVRQQTGVTSEINRLQTELSNLSISPQRKTELEQELADLLNYRRGILEEVGRFGGVPFTPRARTEGSSTQPPGPVIHRMGQ